MRQRGFTLVELMVSSVIAFIIVAAGAALASAIARQVRETEEQGDIGARVAIASSVVQNALDGVMYSWRVEGINTGPVGSGGPGHAHCETNTNLCETVGAETLVKPLAVCSSTGLTETVCNPPNVNSADGIRAIVPRDDVSEAVRIVEKNGAFFSVNCDAGNVPDGVTVDVLGEHTNAWADGDLVLVTSPGHATVGRVRSALPAVGLTTVPQQLDLSIDGDNLEWDDGGAAPCDAQESLVGARIIRVKVVVLRLNGTTLEMSQRGTTTATGFVPLLTDVEDFQVRLDTVQLETGDGQYCIGEGPAINNILYSDANVNGTAPCNNGLDRDDPVGTGGNAPNDNVIRVAGLHVAMQLRAGSQTSGFTRPVTYLFDRTGPAVPADQRRRRGVFFYVGLTNAAQY